MRRFIVLLIVLGAAGCGGRRAGELADKNKGFAENLQRAIRAKDKTAVEKTAQDIDKQKASLSRFSGREYESLMAVCEAVKEDDWEDAERLVNLCLGDKAKKQSKAGPSKPGGI